MTISAEIWELKKMYEKKNGLHSWDLLSNEEKTKYYQRNVWRVRKNLDNKNSSK